MKASRLEDFGVRGVVSPVERLQTYRNQAKELPPRVKAKFWIGVLDRDPEVKRLVDSNGHDRRRRY